MKKTLYIVLIVAIALVSVITGCSDNKLTEEGVLNISINGMGSRGIEPVSMETVRYDITVKNSSNATIYTGWADLDDDLTLSIPPGLYKVSVNAKNADGLVIGSGYAEGEVAAGSTTELLIVVNELKGDGVLSIEVMAKEDQGIAYTILSGDGKNCGSGLLGYDGDVFFDEVELPNGFYILQIMDSETNKVLKSQTVRIVMDQVTAFFTKVAYIGDTPIYSRYSIGDIGPAGGYIFYDCDADNASGNADGLISTEVGWRYLEAAPADIHMVKGVPSIDSKLPGYSSGKDHMSFGYYRTSAYGSNLYVNGTTTYDSSDCTGTAIGTGQKNTQMLVSVMREDVYLYSSDDSFYDTEYYSNKVSDYAARMCDILEYENNGVVYDDWFLPSKDELNQMYLNLYVKRLGCFAENNAYYEYPYYYWSSSEDSTTVQYVWSQCFIENRQFNYYREKDQQVRPIRAFLTGDEVMEPHTHKFSEKWSFDGDNHWHKPICIHLDEKSEFGEHEFVGDVCVVCGFSTDMSSLFELDEDGNIYPIDKSSLPNYVIIPAQVGVVAVTGIGENAFSGCSFIDTVIIPDSVTRIGREAFFDCSGLRNISFGNSLTDIGDGAFFACSSLESLIIPHSVKTIGECLFYGCTSLDYLSVPESVEVIDQWAFYACNPAFFECESPAFVGCQFDNKAFQILETPSELTISSLYNSIDAYAFAKTDIESITIPTSVMSIGECAFYGSEKLRSITYQGTKAQWNAIVKADDWSSGVSLGCVIKCKDGTIDLNDMSYLFDITLDGYIYPKDKNKLPSEVLIPNRFGCRSDRICNSYPEQGLQCSLYGRPQFCRPFQSLADHYGLPGSMIGMLGRSMLCGQRLMQ